MYVGLSKYMYARSVLGQYWCEVLTVWTGLSKLGTKKTKGLYSSSTVPSKLVKHCKLVQFEPTRHIVRSGIKQKKGRVGKKENKGIFNVDANSFRNRTQNYHLRKSSRVIVQDHLG